MPREDEDFLEDWQTLRGGPPAPRPQPVRAPTHESTSRNMPPVESAPGPELRDLIRGAQGQAPREERPAFLPQLRSVGAPNVLRYEPEALEAAVEDWARAVEARRTEVLPIGKIDLMGEHRSGDLLAGVLAMMGRVIEALERNGARTAFSSNWNRPQEDGLDSLYRRAWACVAANSQGVRKDVDPETYAAELDVTSQLQGELRPALTRLIDGIADVWVQRNLSIVRPLLVVVVPEIAFAPRRYTELVQTTRPLAHPNFAFAVS